MIFLTQQRGWMSGVIATALKVKMTLNKLLRDSQNDKYLDNKIV